ncbi:protein FAM193A-like [Saccostrea echinata]|uniref:protein FAM193A-like n=1 Tax=Saccostrea echinata TaxID=191078 RepID=UPI002A82761D|nr:protein FAM193A-like [Saccostrea echinata]
MSGLEERKAKRRRHKGSSVVKTSNQTCQSFPGSLGFDMSNPAPKEILSPSLDSETMQKLEKLMDAKDDSDLPQLLSLSRGPNPYLDKERCLLCGCERNDAPEPLPFGDTGGSNKSLENSLSQLPLWVCLECRKATEQGIDRKVDITSFMDADLPPEPSPLPFLDPGLDSEPTTPNGTVCNCEACTERRQIETEHDRETQELQNCWTELRKLVRMLYGRREGDLYEEDTNVPNSESAQELVHRLCARDPHQLFLRLESQVREFVIEMKVKLLKQLNSGYKSPPESKSFIQLLLDEYGHLCKVSAEMGKILEKLKTDHLSKFNVTWELHNKHLFQSIAYTEPSIQSSLHLIISQLRLGAASKESYHEDTYPNLLHQYLKFDDEMSVISVVWRDSHQLIEQYNEEQATLKLKQKMLKEDWEFFKAQRKILEEQVAKSASSPVAHSFEAQFTETMRMMLQGTKPGPEECHCPRCNRKRCPCDECTITHMITCGIINPEALEASNPGGHPTFLHDPNRYRIDVSPPSMSSTTSSSGSSSPLIHERLNLPFNESAQNREDMADNDNNQSNDVENEDGRRLEEENQESLDVYDEDDDDEEEDDDDEEEDDDKEAGQMSDMDICDEEEDDDEDDELDNYDIDYDEEDDSRGVRENSQEKTKHGIRELISPSMYLGDEDDDEALEDLISSEKCDCFHCKKQAQNEQKTKQEENSCKCYACLREQGNTVSTSLPQTIAPETSRPAELHLYPHIHGSPSLHPLANHHVPPPLLPTQLYDLHMPIRQPKSLLQTTGKVLPKLDFDSPEGIHEHMYHAYGEWDNTYNASIPFQKYSGISTDLLPPPPLTTNFNTASFLNEPFSVATQMGVETVSTTTIPTSAFKTSVSHHVSLSTPQSMANITNVNHDHTAVMVSHSDLPVNSMTPPCTRPVTLGGNISQKQTVGPTPSVTSDQKQHSQHCKRHNSTLLGKNNASCQAHNNNNNASTVKVTQELFSAARNIRENAKEGMQMIRQFANSLNANNNTHSCNHNNRNPPNHVLQPNPDHNHCPNGVSMPTTVNNVSVGTSTVCMEPNCSNHCGDENCDSVDDSCSDPSSLTSSSNQKEGKYCDCCYCEFFGHGNPPVAPTSKNYEEMRNRLRLRLKRKQQTEKMQDPHHQNCIMANSNHNNNTPAPPVKPVPPPVCPPEDPVDVKGLDELLNYINGTENKDQAPEKSSKAQKRARQKQRKAEEKARLEAERLKREEEEAEKERQRLALLELEEKEKAAQKKRKKKKKKGLETPNGIDLDLNLVREPPAGKEDDTVTAQKEKGKSSAKKSASNTSQPVGKVKDTSNNASSPRITETRVQDSDPVIHSPKAAKEKNEKSSLPESSKKQGENKKVPLTNGNDRSAKLKTKSVLEEILDGTTKKLKRSTINQSNVIVQPVPVTSQTQKTAVTPQVTTAQQVQQPTQAPKQLKQQSQEQLLKSAPASKQTSQSQKQNIPQSPRQQTRQQVPPARQQQTPEAVKIMQHPPNLHPPFSKITKLSKLTPEEISKQQTLAAQLIAKQQQQQPLPQKHAPRQAGVPASFPQHIPTNIQQNHVVRPCVVQNGKTSLSPGMNGVMFRQPPPPPVFSSQPPVSLLSKSPETKKNKTIKQDDSPPDQGKGGKNKKKNKKNRNSEDLSVIDEIFMPKAEGEIENGEMDEVEKELEEFKRFCLNNTPVKREKLQVNMNLKDIFAKKKSGLGCS